MNERPQNTRLRIGIIGGGAGGTALLEVLKDIPQVHLVGICDIDAQAPALALARQLGIPTYTSLDALLEEHSLEWLINVAHRSVTQRHILARQLSGVTLIDGHIAELIWHLLQDFRTIAGPGQAPLAGEALYGLVWSLVQRIVSVAQPVHSELERIAFHDMLTGLYSRHMLVEFLDREISRAYRLGRPLSLVVLDIDRFKSVNDRFGHDAGDQVLVQLAGLLKDSCRASDLAARYGGEEFVAVLPNTDLKAASLWAERMRQRTAEKLRRPDGTPLTISLGVAALEIQAQATHDQQVSSSHLFNQADKAMYQAKNSGRNRVAAAQLPVA